jgi:hypothetical protein
MTRTFQSRMGKYQDALRRKIIDNNISLSGQASDCIRIRIKRTRQGDIKSRVVEEADVISVIFPPIKDAPFRRMTLSKDVTKLEMETLPAVMDLFPIEIVSTQIDKIYKDDLIFRVLQEPDIPNPMVLALQVVEPKGTWGVRSMIYAKYDCTYYQEQLSQEILEIIAATTLRRTTLGW